MKFSHREAERDGRVLDILTDEENGLRLTTSRLGAEMVSLARRDSHGNWIGFLYRDDDLSTPAKGWANHATVMGFYLHRLQGERTLYRGKEMRGGSHGFLRHKIWRAETSDTNSGAITYQMAPGDFSAEEYPLKVSLDLTYRIEHESVRVIFSFKNHEPELTAHVGFGVHPGFAAASFESFRFVLPAGFYRRHFSPDNFLSGETEDIFFEGGELPFPREKLSGSFILELVDVPQRKFFFADESSGREITLDLTGVPYLTLWSDGGPFLCVEPCWGLTDHHEQRAFEDKEGIQKILPNEQLTAEFSIHPQL